jgi:hypothetical protein
MIGDTVDETARNESLTDAEVDLVLSEYTDLHQAAMVACRRLMARLRKKITFSAGAVSAQMREKLGGLREILSELKAESRGHAAMDCYAGMMSQDRIDDAKTDTDFPGHDFELGQDDNPNDRDPDDGCT